MAASYFKSTALTPALLLTIFILPVSATTIRVPQDQPTVQAGINGAVNGDTVLVAPGVYTGNLTITGKNLSLLSLEGADRTVIIAANAGVPTVHFSGGTDSSSRLSGFTVKGAIDAAGIRCDRAGPIIENNIVRNNTGTEENHHGITVLGSPNFVVIRNNQIRLNSGGILVGEANTIITGNFIDSNSTSTHGGGIFLRNSIGSGITRNLVTNNTSAALGGGILISNSINCKCENNTIAGNFSNNGSGLLLWYSSTPAVKNNIIANNSPNHGLASVATDNPANSYNDVWNNSPADYVGIIPGIGAISADPLFAGGSPFDYSLQNGSPCIDAGDPSTPVPIGGGARVDIGAFEHHGLALLTPISEAPVDLRRPQFAWTSLHDTSLSVLYRVILDSTYVFASADSSPLLVDTVWRFPYQLKLKRSYFWKVLATTNDGDTTLSSIGTFFVDPKVLLAYPPDSSRVSNREFSLVWNALRDTSISNSFTYQVHYSEDPSLSNAIASPVLTDTFWQTPTPLVICKTYYWKVVSFYSTATDTLQSPLFSFLLSPTSIFVRSDRQTIQEAIDVSLNGDTIFVEPGIYPQNIFFNGKSIKVLSEAGPENTTIINMSDEVPLVNFSGGEDTSAALSGFTLKGARFAPFGAAINIDEASPLIENNLIQDNKGENSVIYITGGSPKIRRNLIAENGTNLAVISFLSGTGGEIANNTIANNLGDGVRIRPAMTMQIKNNILAFNAGYGIRSVGGINNSSTVSYNDISGNSLGRYLATIPTTGDIFQDPLFRDGNPFDYHLLTGSPCIDAGDPTSPVPPGWGTRIDIGAFEFVPTAGDLNGDGVYSATDIVLLLNCAFHQTGSCNFAMTDLNCDGQLTGADIVWELGLVFQQIPPPC